MRFPSLHLGLAYNPPSLARMVKLVDTRDLKSLAARRTGSIPVPGTTDSRIMIIFDLSCRDEHRFEGWFRSTEDFSRQLERGLVSCPHCGSAEIRRLPSAAHLVSGTPGGRGNGAPASTDVVTPESALAVLKAVVDRVIAGSEDVGKAFAEEARKIHYHESPERAIRGEASAEEFAALQEEGIEVLRLPGHDKKTLN